MFAVYSRQATTRAISLLAAIAFLQVLLEPGWAQQVPAHLPENPTNGGNIDGATGRTPYEFWLTCLIGALGLVVIGTVVYSLRKVENIQAADVTRPIIIITVIMGTLILVTAGYSNQQIAPAFGLLGTIVGYVLGRAPAPTASGETSPSERKPGAGDKGTANS